MDQSFIKTMLTLHLLAAKETFGKDAVVALNAGEPGVYVNNPTVKEFEAKGYELCDANMFGEGLERMEVVFIVTWHNSRVSLFIRIPYRNGCIEVLGHIVKRIVTQVRIANEIPASILGIGRRIGLQRHILISCT